MSSEKDGDLFTMQKAILQSNVEDHLIEMGEFRIYYSAKMTFKNMKTRNLDSRSGCRSIIATNRLVNTIRAFTICAAPRLKYFVGFFL